MSGDVRGAVPGDLAGAAALERRCFSVPWSQESFRQELENPDSVFLVLAPAEGELDGFCILRCLPPEGELLNLAVAPERRGRGAGEHLLRAALDAAAARGAERIFLEVRASNAAAGALYQKTGFRMTGRRRAYYTRPDEDAILMERSETIC